MRRVFVSTFILGGCLALSAQVAKPAAPDPAKSEPVITRAQLEQHLADLKAGKEQAVANVNAFEGAIQECQHWLDAIKAAESPKLALPPKEKK